MGGAYLLGIDAGTTTIKSTLFDLTGHELAGAEQQSSLVAPETSWAESDLGEVWKAVQQTVRRTLAQAAVDPAEVVAVGVTGQGDGSWLIDRQGRPVRPALLWCDGRTAPLVELLWQEGVGQEEGGVL